MSFHIVGLGTANPPDPISLADSIGVAKVLADPRIAHWVEDIYSGSGVQRRFMIHGDAVVRDITTGTRLTDSPFLLDPSRPHGPSTADRMKMYAEHAPPMAIEAARRAGLREHPEFSNPELRALTQPGSPITHLVTVSCTGFVSPGVEFRLITELGLPNTVQRVNVGFMGCHAAINGLRVAHAITTATPTARVLLVCVELCSLHYYYGGDPGKLIANALFADGAAAVIGTGEASDSSLCNIVGTGSCLIPNSSNEMGWIIGNSGFEMVLTKKVPRLIAANVKPFLEQWLAGFGLTLAEIGSWLVHPGGPKVLTSVEEGLGLPAGACDISREVLSEYGNMSSPTVLFILQRLLERKRKTPAVILGFGPGLVAEAALVM